MQGENLILTDRIVVQQDVVLKHTSFSPCSRIPYDWSCSAGVSHGQQCHDTHTLALLHLLTGQPVVALSLFPMSLYVSEFQPSAAALSTSITSLPMTKY